MQGSTCQVRTEAEAALVLGLAEAYRLQGQNLAPVARIHAPSLPCIYSPGVVYCCGEWFLGTLSAH